MPEIPTYILCIEVANAVTSVAICKDGACLFVKNIEEVNKAADRLHLLIADLLAETNLTFGQLNAVAISAGPGSYTGLRIATSAAKGFCFSLDIPLIAISTLEAMVNGIQTRYRLLDFNQFVPMIDARRMEVFTSFYNGKLVCMKYFSSLILDETLPALFDITQKYILFGNGAVKTKSWLNHNTIIVFENFTPSAQDLCLLAFQRYSNKKFEDIAYYEPNYAKAFYSTANK